MRAGIIKWLACYNAQRPHSTPGILTPDEAYDPGAHFASGHRVLSRRALGRVCPAGGVFGGPLRKVDHAPQDAGYPNMTSPLDSIVLFQIGPVAITQAIVTT